MQGKLMKHLLPLFPFILKSKHSFEHQNKLLNKVTLTGKINADSTTTNLFDFADNTNSNFAELQDNLINILLQENMNTLINELKSKASVTIDILIRNLFERTADVGFLATDNLIIEFLTDDTVSEEKIKNHLKSYVAKYSVYNEIVVFDLNGEVKIHLNDKNNISAVNDPVLRETLNTNSYVERYEYTEIFKTQNKTLTYTQKILDNHHRPIGILCLCFKFEDEMQRIFENTQTNNETILLLQNNKIIASSNIQQYPLDQHFRSFNEEYQVINSQVAVSAKTSGYQGYFGLNWSAVVIKDTTRTTIETNVKSTTRKFVNQNIRDVIEQADNIVEDLSDIIINGELIAAKRRMYLLNPILDNLRLISANMLETIKEAGNNLELLGEQSLSFNLISSSKLAMDIMDRNLYERANDSRWWAMTPLFIDALSSETINTKEFNSILSYINNLYTVYTNIFIYNNKGTIVASSNEADIIGRSPKS